MTRKDESMKPSQRTRNIAYWITTILVTAELAVGGVWDIIKLPIVTKIIVHLGYPLYFLIILGVWKLLGAVALLIPGLPRVKEWAYAGAMFNYSGAIISLIIMDDGFSSIAYPLIQMSLVIASWALRPPSRGGVHSHTQAPTGLPQILS